MKYDLRTDPNQERLLEFRSWLLKETISGLGSVNGNEEEIRAAIFLFVNRALEAHLPEETIGELLGIAAIRAGLAEKYQELAFDEADAAIGTFSKMYKLT